MDDNKLLTLPNGERIKLKPSKCTLIFEVGDLNHASPATVSRAGMIYLDSDCLDGIVIWKRWLKNVEFVIFYIIRINF